MVFLKSSAELRDKLWAYPWMMGFLVIFIGYQSYLLAISRHGDLVS
jgi:uncharacterized membrane protein